MGPAWILRVVVSTFSVGGSGSGTATTDWRSVATADELAERLALTDCAVVDRDHVRAVETSAPGVDSTKLQALGKKLKADVVVGGEAGKVVVYDVKTGAVAPFEWKPGRPDAAAAALALAIAESQKVAIPATARAPLQRTLGSDADYEAYGKARLQLVGASTAEVKRKAAGVRHPLAPLLAARARFAEKDYAGARVEALRASEAMPGSRQVLLQVARAEDYAERDESAIAAYRAVLAVAPHDAIAHSNLARLLNNRLDPEAMRHYEAAVEAEPAWPAPRFNLAVAMLDGDEVERALGLLEQLHTEAPTEPIYATYLGRALIRADRPGAAVPLLRKVLEERPGDVGARAELVLALAASNQLQEAKKLLDSNETEIRLARARVLLAERHLDEAAAELGGHANLIRAQRALGVVRLLQQRPAEAQQVLRTVVDQAPRDYEAQFNLGLALWANKDAAGARAAWQAAQQVAPSRVPAALALARERLDAGDAAAAEQVLEPALAKHGKDGRLLLLRGHARWRKNPAELAGVLADFEAAEHDVQARIDARYALCEALWAAGRKAEAQAAARRYLDIEDRADRASQRARAAQIAK